MRRERVVQDWKITLELGPQVLRVDAPENERYEEPPLAALPSVSPEFVSAAVLGHKAKALDDALYAAVEQAAQAGLGTFPSKAQLLERWAHASLRAGAPPEISTVLLAACELGDHPVGPLPESLNQAAHAVARSFSAERDRAQPLGLYTWSPALAALFRQDRFLMGPLEPPTAGRLAGWLSEDPALAAAYGRMLQLAARMTNPPAPDHRDLLSPGAPGVTRRVLPPSRSHETELLLRLYGNRPIPEGFQLAEVLAQAVSDGAVSLAPTATSGWYDHQAWALEPLVAPGRAAERTKLELTERYRAHLREVFKGLLALTRETHVKQLQPVEAGAIAGPPPPQLRLRPDLCAEPVATHYARRALSYRFVRGVLEELFGPAWRTLRLANDRYSVTSLEEALEGAEALFFGAHVAVMNDLGLEPDVGALPDRHPALDEDTFRNWAKGASRDMDLRRDARMMVPVFYDVQRRQMKVWAVLGWAERPVQLDYAERPEIYDVEPPPQPQPLLGRLLGRKPPAPPPQPEIVFEPAHRQAAFPVTVELYVRRTLDPEAFRALCDRHQTQTRILRALRTATS